MSPEFGGPKGPETNTSKDRAKIKNLRFLPEANKEKPPKSAEAPKEQAPPQPRINEAILHLLRKDSEEKDTEKVPGDLFRFNKEKPKDSDKKVEKAEPAAAVIEISDTEKNKENEETAAAETEAEKPSAEALAETASESSEPKTAEENEGSEEADRDQNAEAYNEMRRQELRPNQRGSEVVVNLNGDEPIVEQEIPLHGEVSALGNPDTEFMAQETQQNPSGEAEPSEHPASAPESNPEPVSSPEPAESATAPELIPLAPETGTGGGGEVPPADPPELGGESPDEPDPDPEQPEISQQSERTEETESGGSFVGAGGSGNFVRPSERPATKKELDEAFARSARVHGQRGVLSGLFFGTLLANRKIKNRQKQETKALRKQSRELENLTKQYETGNQNQERQQLNTERRFAAVDKRFESIQHPEKATAQEKAEKARTAELVKIDPGRQELLQVPDDHHLETSSWHTIEVDNKTGKPVENPAFQYGHEYYRERSAEAAPIDQRTAAAGGLALGAITTQTSGDSQQQGSTKASIPSATSQEPPKSAKERAKGALGALTKSDGKGGPLWPYLIALAVVIVLLVSVLS